MTDSTQILNAIEQGDPSAAEQLLPLVYDELRKLAAQKMAQENPGQTLQATGLVHEAYIRLVGSTENAQHWGSRGHFFAAAAEAMRRILVEAARRKQKVKQGGEFQRLPLALEGKVTIPLLVPPTPEIIAGSPDTFVDFFRVRIDQKKAQDTDQVVQFVFTDKENKAVGLHVRRGVVEYVPVPADYYKQPDYVLELDSEMWAAMYLSSVDLEKAAADGKVKLTKGAQRRSPACSIFSTDLSPLAITGSHRWRTNWKAPFPFEGKLKRLYFKNLQDERPAFKRSPDDRQGGDRDVTTGSVLRLERFQAQPKWELPGDGKIDDKRK